MRLTLRKYLSPHESRGPYERKSVHFQDADLDTRALLMLLREDPRLAQVLCIPKWNRPCPNLRACVLFTDARAVLRGTGNGTLCAPRDLAQRLRACRPCRSPCYSPCPSPCRHRSPRHRFAAANFGVYLGKSTRDGHSNALLFDLHAQVVEREMILLRERSCSRTCH